MNSGEMSSISYCPFCGRKRVEEGRFCVACGRPFPVSGPNTARLASVRMEPPEPESPPEPTPALSPHVEPAGEPAPEGPVCPETDTPPSVSHSGPFFPAVLTRALTALAMFVTAALTFYYFVGFVGLESKVRVPYTYSGVPAGPVGGPFNLQGLGAKTVWRTYQSPHNGVSVAGFITMALATLLLANRLFRRRAGTGPVDRLVAALAGPRFKGRILPFLLPAALTAFAIGWIATYFTTPVGFHLDAKEAVRQLSAAGIQGWDLSQTGPFVFGEGDRGQVRVALLTPSLVRELKRNGMRIGGKEGPREYQIPGALPLAFMAALIAWALLGRRTRVRFTLLPFGILNGYVVAWMVSSQAGVMDGNGTVDLFWMIHFAPFGAAALAVLAAIHYKVETLDLPLESRQGWMSLFLLAGAAMPLGSYFLSNASKGSPAALWVFLYAALSALYVMLARLDPPVSRGQNR